jgi:alcohol dehydrogenase class IV
MSAPSMNAFHVVTQPQEIVFGAGSIKDLAVYVERTRWQRLMICASPSTRRNGQLDRIETMLGSRAVATYEQVRPHVQEAQVAEASALAGNCHVDAVMGIGGGSAIGMAKAISFALEEGSGTVPGGTAPAAGGLVPVIAIPTTYAGSEMTPIFGVTRAGETPRKTTVRDPKITPRLVIYDPELTLDLPPQITASTGVNALAHCVEALYSVARNPLATAAARSGLEYIARALPQCTENGSDLAARSDMLIGSHLSALALSSTQMGLHHGLCHVLGGSANVPHGYANSIILPHAMAFNADAAGAELAQVALVMGWSGGGEADDKQGAARRAVDGMYGFIGRLDLPQRLRDVGVPEGDLGRLAALSLQSRAVQDNPKRVVDAAQLEVLLRAAW